MTHCIYCHHHHPPTIHLHHNTYTQLFLPTSLAQVTCAKDDKSENKTSKGTHDSIKSTHDSIKSTHDSIKSTHDSMQLLPSVLTQPCPPPSSHNPAPLPPHRTLPPSLLSSTTDNSQNHNTKYVHA